MNEKIRAFWDKLVRTGKYSFPVIVLVAVAVTVVIALQAGGVRRNELEQIGEVISTVESESESIPESTVAEGVPLELNSDNSIASLVATYYNAVAYGDEETLSSVCDKIEDKDMIRFRETAKYIDRYSFLETYVKPGFGENEIIAYVYFKVIFTGKDAEYPGYQMLYIRPREDGSKYIFRSSLSDEEAAYVQAVSTEADVLDLTNRVTVEYDNLITEQPELLSYLNDLNEEVNRIVGVELAKLESESQGVVDENPDAEGAEDPEESQAPEASPAPPEKIYAVANTTVNVRRSDSEKAERIGRVSGGTKIQVLEQLVNGWSKVIYENQEGYIMSKYLDVQESSESYATIGKVVATDNINVRAQAGAESTKLGTLLNGEEADLIAVEGEWCKIKFNGQVAYVKGEYVKVQ